MHNDPPRLADIVPDAPAALVETVEQCLKKSPDDRPQSIRDVAVLFQEIARARGEVTSNVVLIEGFR